MASVRRRLLLLLGACCLVAWLAPEVGAQTVWPDYPLPGPHQISRGAGGYLSPVKLFACWLLFLAWVGTTDWINRDCQRCNMPYGVWVPVGFFPLIVALILGTWTIPMFVVGYPLAVLAWGVPALVYVVKRNSTMPPHEKVLTGEHLRFVFATWAGKVGIKIHAERKAPHQAGAGLNLDARGGATPEQNQANLFLAQQLPGFVAAKNMIAEAIQRRADKIMLDYSAEAVAHRYQVDGVWHEADNQEREEGDSALAVMKKIAALNPEDRRARQEGQFGVEFNQQKFVANLVSQGTKTGERVIVQLAGKSQHVKTLDDAGMRSGMQEEWGQLIMQPRGILLVCGMPAGGLTTTMDVLLNAADRYMRDVVAIEEEAAREPVVENVEVTTYNAAAGETPATVLPRLIRKQPNVIVVRELPDAESIRILCEVAADDKLVVATLRAKEAVEALLRVLLLKVRAVDFSPVAIGVLNMRLVRKLCDQCKEGYAPPAELMKKLGLAASKVEMLYRPPQEPEETCLTCNGIGYLGRTAIFELLKLDDAMREALVKQPKLDVLRDLARKAGNRSLQEEGIALVARGVTSLAELSRVLKQ